MQELIRDTWLEVDLQQLGANVAALRQTLGDHVTLYGVLKANAYGCGLEAMGQALIALEVPLLAVATLSEALVLRRFHPTWPILVMGPTPHRLMPVALTHEIQLTLVSNEDIEILEALAQQHHVVAQAHIKVDTGLRRVGFETSPEDLSWMEKALRSDWLIIKGIFSHLALVNWEQDQLQLQRFTALKDHFQALGLTNHIAFHLSDSISAIAYPEFRFDAVRVGAALYGMKSYRYPDYPIRPITRLMSRIAQIKRIEAGEGVGYDHLWVAQRVSYIATLPFGYADGYPREMQDKGYVVIRGWRCPIVGILCMDQSMVDITDLKGCIMDIKVGEEAIVYGPGDQGEQTISEIADLIKSNKNDILTRISERVPRVYK